MGLTTKTHRTFGTRLLMIWVVVVFVLDGLQASPVRDHSSISQDSKLQHLVGHRKIIRRETSVLIDDSFKVTSHNIREDIRPDPGPSVYFQTSSSLPSSQKILTPSQKLRWRAISARSSLLSSLTGTSRRKPLPLVQNHLDIIKSKKREEIITTTISSLKGNILEDFELLPLDNADYYYDLDGETILLEDMLTTNIDTTTSKLIVAETAPAPIDYTQTTSSKSTNTVSLSSSNKPVETTESAIPTSKTTMAIIEASTESTSENPIPSTQRSVTASIHVSISPVVSTTSFKTTAITPRSFRYTTLKPSQIKDQANVLLNRIRDLSSSSRIPNSEISPLIQNAEKFTNKEKKLKEHRITRPLQLHLLSDQLVVQISSAPKVTSQRQSRTKFKSSSSSTSSVGGSPSSTSTSSVGGSPISQSTRNVGVLPSSISTSNVDNSASTTSSSSLDISTSASSTTSKPRTTILPVITSTTELNTLLEPDIISEKNVEASRKSQSRSVSTSSVRLEVHTVAESAPVEVFENLPSKMENIAKASPPLELIKQQGAAPLGLSTFGLSPLGPMPFGSHPQGQLPFGLHPQGLPRQANITDGKSATTPESTLTITQTVPPTTDNTSSKPNTPSTTTTSKPCSFPIPSATTNEKVGYIVEEENQSRFQLEQVTKDGFIIGEFGSVNHSNGAVSGVRYTADDSVDHKLIHEALQSFLSL